MTATDEEGAAQRLQAKVLESQFRFAFFSSSSVFVVAAVVIFSAVGISCAQNIGNDS